MDSSSGSVRALALDVVFVAVVMAFSAWKEEGARTTNQIAPTSKIVISLLFIVVVVVAPHCRLFITNNLSVTRSFT